MMHERGLSVNHSKLLILKARPLTSGCQMIVNNIIEQDHRHIKKITNRMLGFKNFISAYNTISGIEALHMIHKGQAGTSSIAQEVKLINQLLNVA